jgi:hypothetical protein
MTIFDISVPDLGCKDADAIRLVPYTGLPHAHRWKVSFSDYSSRIAAEGVLDRSEIREIDDDEDLLIDGDNFTRIGRTFPPTPVDLSAQPAA